MSGLRIGGRPIGTVLRAVLEPRHYRAAINMVRVYPSPWREFWRYFARSGSYPYRCRVRTPLGVRGITLETPDDLLTVNEIFCRIDYGLPSDATTVVDLGSNIGVSGLYFLTRSPRVRTWLFEPDPRNVVRLRETLAGLEDRYVLEDVAVADREGVLSFGIEPTGRYGGLDVDTGERIDVRCRHINDVLGDVLATVEVIDLLKIDTEGAELPILRAIDERYLGRIRAIVVEMEPVTEPLHPAFFDRSRRGNVELFTNRHLEGMQLP